MSNYGNFAICRTAAEANAYLRRYWEPRQPSHIPARELTLKWSIALFWLGAFSPQDEVTVTIPADERRDDDYQFVAYCASTAQAAANLEGRKSSVLSLLPPDISALYSDLFDEWVAYVREVDGFAVLDAIEVFELFAATRRHMLPETALRLAFESLRRMIEMIAGADGQSLAGAREHFRDLGVMCVSFEETGPPEGTAWQWRASLVGVEIDETWPPRPGRSEIEFAASLPNWKERSLP